MTFVLVLAGLLAASVGVNWLLLRRQRATAVELAELRTELARVIEAGRIQAAHETRKADAAAEVRARTAARLEHEPSAVEVRSTIDRIRRRRR